MMRCIILLYYSKYHIILPSDLNCICMHASTASQNTIIKVPFPHVLVIIEFRCLDFSDETLRQYLSQLLLTKRMK